MTKEKSKKTLEKTSQKKISLPVKPWWYNMYDTGAVSKAQDKATQHIKNLCLYQLLLPFHFDGFSINNLTTNLSTNKTKCKNRTFFN